MNLVEFVDEMIEGQWMEISCESEMQEYETHLFTELQKEIVKLLRSGCPPMRFDHYRMSDEHVQGVWAMSVATSRFAENANPLYHVGPMMAQKITAMRKYLTGGETLFVNPKGGYFPDKGDKLYEVVGTASFKKPLSDYVHIAPGAEVINLENDPMLEQCVLERLGKPDQDFSYVVNLRAFSKKDLIGVLREFVEAGGTTIYQYTTGVDVPQMYDYVDAAEEVGVKKIQFVFTAGIDENIQQFLDKCAQHNTMLTIEVL